MKKNSTILITILFLLFVTKQSTADHLPGGYITVRYSGSGNIYTIKVVYFRDCIGLPAPSQIGVNYSINGGLSSSINLPLVSSTVIPLVSCIPQGFTCQRAWCPNDLHEQGYR